MLISDIMLVLKFKIKFWIFENKVTLCLWTRLGFCDSLVYMDEISSRVLPKIQLKARMVAENV